MTEVQSRRWASHRGLLAALWLTLMILAMKVWVGFAIQSLSLLASSIHTLVTSFSLILSWLTLAFPHAPSRDTWGHRPTDTILTLGVTGLIGFTGCTVMGLAIQQLSTIWMGGVILQAEPINLPLIHLFIGMIAIIGFAIANGWRVLNRQIPSLVSQVAIAPEAVTRSIRRVEGILHCYGIRSQGMVGRWIYVEMSLILHPEYLHLSNTIIHQAQQAICQDYGSAQVVIHIDRDSVKPIPQGNSATPLRS